MTTSQTEINTNSNQQMTTTTAGIDTNTEGGTVATNGVERGSIGGGVGGGSSSGGITNVATTTKAASNNNGTQHNIGKFYSFLQYFV